MDSRAGGAQNNNNVHKLWLRPSIGEFFFENGQLLGGQTLDRTIFGRVLSKYSALLKSSDVLSVPNLIFHRILFSHVFQLGMANAGKRVRQFRIRAQSFALCGADGDLPNRVTASVVALTMLILDLRFCMGDARGITVSMRGGHPGKVKAEGKRLLELLQGDLGRAKRSSASLRSETVGGGSFVNDSGGQERFSTRLNTNSCEWEASGKEEGRNREGRERRRSGRRKYGISSSVSKAVRVTLFIHTGECSRVLAILGAESIRVIIDGRCGDGATVLCRLAVVLVASRLAKP